MRRDETTSSQDIPSVGKSVKTHQDSFQLTDFYLHPTITFKDLELLVVILLLGDSADTSRHLFPRCFLVTRKVLFCSPQCGLETWEAQAD